MAATLSVPFLGSREQRIEQEKSDDLITIQLPLIEAHVEANNHLQADSCNVTVDWRLANVDTRNLDHGLLTVYFGNADEQGRWTPTTDDVVFIGHLKNPERSLDADGAAELRLEAVDYTSLFLEAQPFGSSGIPSYSDTLLSGYQRICSQVPGAGILAESVVFRGGADPNAKLGEAVSSRFAKLSKIPTKPDTDALAVVQQMAGMLGLIFYIDRDVAVFTTSTSLDTSRDPPVFRWGENLESLSESRMIVQHRAGVALAAYDPMAGKAIEVFWPPIGDERVQRKIVAARRRKDPPLALSSEREKRLFLTIEGVTNVSMLERIARNVWEHYRRQELSGCLSTPHMLVRRANSKRLFETWKLRSGDSIVVDVANADRQTLNELSNELLRVRYLLDRGYPKDVATLLAKNVEGLGRLGNTFYVDSVRKYMRIDSDGGEFKVDVTFCNEIDVSEGAVGGDEAFDRAFEQVTTP